MCVCVCVCVSVCVYVLGSLFVGLVGRRACVSVICLGISVFMWRCILGRECVPECCVYLSKHILNTVLRYKIQIPHKISEKKH